MAKTRKYGLGSQDDAYVDAVIHETDRLDGVITRLQSSKARLYDAVHSGSHGRTFHAKRALGDAFAHLQKVLAQAETTNATRGRRLRSLPHHAPFTVAHEAARELEKMIARAETAKKRASRMTIGDIDQLRHAFDNERDARNPSRTKDRRISNKVRLLRHEGYPQKQAVAIAYSMYRKKRRAR